MGLTEAFIIGLAFWVFAVVVIIMYACWASNENATNRDTTNKNEHRLVLDGKVYYLR